MARVDVIVPCYNYGNLLDACVPSVLSQQKVDTRVFIMYDASTDSMPEVGKRLAAAIDRLLRSPDVCRPLGAPGYRRKEDDSHPDQAASEHVRLYRRGRRTRSLK